MSEQQTCPLCLEDIHSRDGRAIVSTGCCGNPFHMSCLAKVKKDECPCCRGRINEKQGVRLVEEGTMDSISARRTDYYMQGLYNDLELINEIHAAITRPELYEEIAAAAKTAYETLSANLQILKEQASVHLIELDITVRKQLQQLKQSAQDQIPKIEAGVEAVNTAIASHTSDVSKYQQAVKHTVTKDLKTPNEYISGFLTSDCALDLVRGLYFDKDNSDRKIK